MRHSAVFYKYTKYINYERKITEKPGLRKQD